MSNTSAQTARHGSYGRYAMLNGSALIWLPVPDAIAIATTTNNTFTEVAAAGVLLNGAKVRATANKKAFLPYPAAITITTTGTTTGTMVVTGRNQFDEYVSDSIVFSAAVTQQGMVAFRYIDDIVYVQGAGVFAGADTISVGYAFQVGNLGPKLALPFKPKKAGDIGMIVPVFMGGAAMTGIAQDTPAGLLGSTTTPNSTNVSTSNGTIALRATVITTPATAPMGFRVVMGIEAYRLY